MKTSTNHQLNRGQFLKSLGLGSSALMAFYCIGTLASCGSGNDDPGPGPGPGPGSGAGVTGSASGNNIDFTLDLAHASFSQLKTAGSFVIIGDVLVAFTAGSTYIAVQKLCTHEGSTLAYRSSENDIHCSNHGSLFTTAGAVKQKPNTGDNINSLKTYSTSLSSDRTKLTVKA